MLAGGSYGDGDVNWPDVGTAVEVGPAVGVAPGNTARGDGAWHLDPARCNPARQPAGVATRTIVPAVPRVITVTITAAGHGELKRRLSCLFKADPP